ncbi:MAG: hypothetical protein ACKN9U_26090, partial [Pirellulaceae bacterium]
MSSVLSFIKAYTAADRSRIDLRDFRNEIAKVLIPSPELASDELIRDLYDAETLYSMVSFGVHLEFVSFLAEQLLERGGEANVFQYLECVFRQQDAYFASLCVTLSPGARERAVA